MSKKNKIIVVFVVLMGIVFGVFFFQRSNNKNSSNEDTSEPVTISEDKTKQIKNNTPSENEFKQVHTRENIPFEKYKMEYENRRANFHPGLAANLRACDSEKAIIEFIFLQKNNGKIVPRTRKGGFQIKPVAQADCGAESYPVGGSIEPGLFRFFVMVGKNCHCDGGLIAGKKYRLDNFVHFTRSSRYVIKIPEKEELTFYESIPEDATVEDVKIYRWPIFYDEIMEVLKKEEDEQSEREQEVTITVSGVDERHPNTDLLYKRANKNDVKGTRLSSGKWKIELTKKGNESVLGGDVVVAAASEDEKWLKLIQLKTNIRTRNIDLSDDPDFYSKKHDWVKKKVKMDKYIKKIRSRIPDKLKGQIKIHQWTVLLYLRNHKDVFLYGSKLKKSNNSYFTRLKAPEGKYALKLSSLVVDETFSWPPETSAEEEESGNSEKK